MPLDTTQSAGAVLSATELRKDLFRLGAQTLNMQGRSMLAQRQLNLTFLSDPTGAGQTAVTAQDTMRKAARYYLDVILPALIGITTDANDMRNMIVALSVTLEHTTDAAEAEKIILAAAGQAREFTQSINDTAQKTQMSVTANAQAAKKLDGAINAVISALDGQDGEIAKTRTDIEATEKAVSDAIQAIVDNSDQVGEGVKDLATFVLSFISPSGDAKKDGKAPAEDGKPGEKEKDAKTDDPPKPGADPSGEKTGKIDEFPAQAITTVKTGVAGISEAQVAIQDGNQLLNKQYQSLSQMSAMLAAVQAISGQMRGLDGAGEALLATVGETGVAMGIAAAELKSIAARAAQPDELPNAMIELNASVSDWQRLGKVVEEIKLAMAGMSTFFPPITD